MLAKSTVTIKRIERNKKKFVTAVIGLEAFDLELKKVSLFLHSFSGLENDSAQHHHRSPRILARSLLLDDVQAVKKKLYDDKTAIIEKEPSY